MSAPYAEVALHLSSVRSTLHYGIPDALRGRLQPGHLVVVPLGTRRVQGLVLRLLDEAEVSETKLVESLLDASPVLTQLQMALADWLSTTYLAPLMDALSLMIPAGLARQADSEYRLQEAQVSPRTPAEARLLKLLQEHESLRGRQLERRLAHLHWQRPMESLVRRGAVSRQSVLDPPSVSLRRVRNVRLGLPPEQALSAAQDLGRPGSPAVERRRLLLEALVAEKEPVDVSWVYAETGSRLADLRALESRGLVLLSEAEVWRDPLADLTFVPTDAPVLSGDQQIVWEHIRQAIAAAQGEATPPILLHGVTGSGKTEIYLRAVEETIRIGRGALILVPEISLTPQTVRRFVARFPGQVGLLHSQLSDGERYDTWRRCRQGLLKVVVGPRSALFAPLPEIGLVVVDECHDESYKEQSQSPRYHARETALALSRLSQAVCILGSATPDIETMYRARQGEMTVLRLPQRILAHRRRLSDQAARFRVTARYQPANDEALYTTLPDVEVVDMRQELRAGHTSLFSRILQARLGETLEREEQAILFLNRRGSATHVFCRDCGWVLHCPRCESPLTYHAEEAQALCHRCGYRRKLPSACPECGGKRVRQFGAGTQEVAAETIRLFPETRTIRWDRDTTRTRDAHEVILSHFAAHRADVLVGTQMIAKGLDLPLVTLVGVVSADTALHLPDYRASERTFQLLTQVAGRAGRGLLGGRVVLQSYQPEHAAIQAAAHHDYDAFYAAEIEQRRALAYPPFTRLLRLVYRDADGRAAETEAGRLGRLLQSRLRQRGEPPEIIGPAPCFFERVRGEARWQIVVRTGDPGGLLPGALPAGWTIDVDPVSLL